jgi:hypothetical protein
MMKEQDENKKPTQVDRVLAYLDEHGSITQLDALMDLGVMRLASRISEIIHDRGIEIQKEFVTVKNRFGENCQIVAYKKTA